MDAMMRVICLNAIQTETVLLKMIRNNDSSCTKDLTVVPQARSEWITMR